MPRVRARSRADRGVAIERFPEALEGIPDAVVVVDSDVVVRAGNGRVEATLGYAPAEVEGTPFETLLYDPDDGAAGGGARFEFRGVATTDDADLAAAVDD